MKKDNVFTHMYGVITLLGLGLTVWMVNKTSENEHLFYLSLIAFFLILITFLILNRVLDKLEDKAENIIELRLKVVTLEDELKRSKNISDYLTGQLGQIQSIPRKSVNND